MMTQNFSKDALQCYCDRAEQLYGGASASACAGVVGVSVRVRVAVVAVAVSCGVLNSVGSVGVVYGGVSWGYSEV